MNSYKITIRSTYIILLIFSILSHAHTQNHIRNGSLEEMVLPDELPYPGHWPYKYSYNLICVGGLGYQVYFNAIYNDSSHRSILGVPYNYHGFQFARTGNGYCEIGADPLKMLVFPIYLPIVQGHCYNVRYYVSLADRNVCAVDAIDGYFSTDSLRHQHILKDTIKPQFKNPFGIIDDTMNWTAITGQYIATGKERYFAIGNFYNARFNLYASACSVDTPRINFGTADQSYYLWDRAGYYIDDVAIWECELPEHPADAGPDKQLCRGEEVTIGVMEQRDDYQYFWSDRSWLGPRHTWDTLAITPTLKVAPAKTTTYYLWCVDFKWEHTFDSVTVFVDECDFDLEIPNVFTPNGDGINDYFLIGNPNGVNYTIDVYNRWGTLLFQGNRNFFWDGSFNGLPVSDGTYFYVLQAVNENGSFRKEFRGSVTILR